MWYCILIFFISLGRNPVRLTPGVNIKIPFYHQVSRLDLRESSIAIPNVRHQLRFGYIHIQRQNDSFQDTQLTMFVSFLIPCQFLGLNMIIGSCLMFGISILPCIRWIQGKFHSIRECKLLILFKGLFWSFRRRPKRQEHGNVCCEVGSWNLYLRSSTSTLPCFKNFWKKY